MYEGKCDPKNHEAHEVKVVVDRADLKSATTDNCFAYT